MTSFESSGSSAVCRHLHNKPGIFSPSSLALAFMWNFRIFESEQYPRTNLSNKEPESEKPEPSSFCLWGSDGQTVNNKDAAPKDNPSRSSRPAHSPFSLCDSTSPLLLATSGLGPLPKGTPSLPRGHHTDTTLRASERPPQRPWTFGRVLGLSTKVYSSSSTQQQGNWLGAAISQRGPCRAEEVGENRRWTIRILCLLLSDTPLSVPAVAVPAFGVMHESRHTCLLMPFSHAYFLCVFRPTAAISS